MWARKLIVPSAIATLLASSVLAQDEGDTNNLHWTLGGGFSHQFDADFDEGGDFDVTRASTGAGVSFDLSPQINLGLNLGYSYDNYSFGGTVGLGGMDPWDSVHTVTGGARLTYIIDEHWAVWGAGRVAYSAESGADENAVTGGGLVGAQYTASETLTIGGGVGVLSQIEDDAAVFPVITINWKIAEHWTLRTGGDVGSGGGGALELAWQFEPQWELALGGAYQSRRFRLDDSGVAPDGVGEETSLPIYLQLTYQPDPQARISFYAGLVVAGELQLEDNTGDKIMDDDFDPAAVVGVRASIRY